MLLAENIALQVTSCTNDGDLASDLQLAQSNLHCSALTLERDEQREEVSILRSHNDALQAALARKDLQLAQLNIHCSALTLERDEQRGELSTLNARNDTLQAELRDLNVAMQLTVCCPSPSSVCGI
jgi:chromosome segregation ATPase